MKLGFTGTRHGMSLSQKRDVSNYLSMHIDAITEVHHGCCVGADYQFHQLCMWWGLQPRIILHPPTKSDHLAFPCIKDARRENIRDKLPHLQRNDQIVAECDHILACPPTAEPQDRGGTWYTIRRASEFSAKGEKNLYIATP